LQDPCAPSHEQTILPQALLRADGSACPLAPANLAAGDKLKNWAGNLEYSTDRLYLQIRSNRCANSSRTKQSQGPRHPHCFNNIADSTHNLLSLKPMDQVVALDPRRAL